MEASLPNTTGMRPRRQRRRLGQRSSASAPSAHGRAATPPGQLARYSISRCIGVGGMGAVYEARHAVLNRPVALKTLHHPSADNGLLLARFLREAEIGARVRHAHIVDIYDAGVDAGVPYLVMELLEGETLAAQLAREGRLVSDEAINMVLPLAAALAEVHRRGIVHCDIKPENVFVSLDPQGDVVIKLLDFGVSKDLEVSISAPSPAAGQVADARMLPWPKIEGTPEYMAPEQLRGERHDPRTDQYALGVLLYQCLSGVSPFAASSLLGIAYRVCEGECQPLGELRPDLPEGLVGVVERAMAVRMEDRFPTIEALGLALLPFASAEVGAAYERDFVRDRRSSSPSARRSWLPPPRRAALDDISAAQTAIPAKRSNEPRRVFARSALATAVLMIGGLVSWLAWPTPLQADRDDALQATYTSAIAVGSD